MIFGIIALIVIVLIVLWGVSAYNGLVTLRNRVKNGWAQIDVQLKQRRPHPESRGDRQGVRCP